MLPDQAMLFRQIVRLWHLEITDEHPGQSNSDDADVHPGADAGDAWHSEHSHFISWAISRGKVLLTSTGAESTKKWLFHPPWGHCSSARSHEGIS